MKAKIRKIVTIVEEVRQEMGRDVTPPVRRSAALAVIANPFAGRYVDDLGELIDIGEELGALLSERAVAALGIPGEKVESYGKAAAVGENGELEHAAASRAGALAYARRWPRRHPRLLAARVPAER